MCQCKRCDMQRHPLPSAGPPLPREPITQCCSAAPTITLLFVPEVLSLEVLEHGEHVATLASAPHEARQRARSRSARAMNAKPCTGGQRASSARR